MSITKFLTEIRDNDTDGYFTLGENTENEITIQWFRPRTKYRQIVISNYPKPFKKIFYQGIICYDYMNHSFVGSIEPNNLVSCKIWVDCLGNPPGYQPSMRVIVIGHWYKLDRLLSSSNNFLYTRTYWLFFIPKNTKTIIIFEHTEGRTIAGRAFDYINIVNFELGQSYYTHSRECLLTPVTTEISNYVNISEFGMYYWFTDYSGGSDNSFEVCFIQ